MTADEKELVTLKKEQFKRDMIVQREAEVEVPELNQLMGLTGKQVATVKVRQASLDDVIRFRLDSVSQIKNLMDGIVEAALDRETVSNEFKEALTRMNPETELRIDLVHTCLVEPKLNRSDIVFLSQMFPTVITRIYTKIMEITNSGADLKKNSIS